MARESQFAIAANFAADPIRLPLRCWLDYFGWPGKINFAPFNQVFQQLLSHGSLFSENAGGVNLLLLALDLWGEDTSKIAERCQEFQEAATTFSHRSRAPTLVLSCAPTSQAILPDELRLIESKLLRELAGLHQFQVVDSAEIERFYPVADFHDATTWRTAQIPYTQSYFNALATLATRRIARLRQPPPKVIAVDCDNTLWSGICGEDGAAGVQVLPGHACLQRRLLELRSRGTLLCIASRNNEQDVWDVFSHNPAMILKPEHFTECAISWENKAEGLQSLAARLQLALDSFLLLDDSPHECEIVQTACPQVDVLRVPAPEKIPRWLDHIWLFDARVVTAEDSQRAAAYTATAQRNAELAHASSLQAFLANLELKVTFLEPTQEVLTRLSQLTQRTNQFNTSLRRHDLSSITAWLQRPDAAAFCVAVEDKFGDYGIVGAVLYETVAHRLRVDSLLLSCRALGRGVEHHMLKRLGTIASQGEISEIEIPLTHGPRNLPARLFLESIAAVECHHEKETSHYRFAAQTLSALDPLQVDLPGRDVQPTPEFRATSSVARPQLAAEIATRLDSVEKIAQWIARQAAPRPQLEEPYLAPASVLERQVAEQCAGVLHLETVGLNDSLHDLGCGSLQIVQLHSRLLEMFETDISITELYSLSTVRSLVERVEGQRTSAQERKQGRGRSRSESPVREGIAIIGMAGRFPGAPDINVFWQNIIRGVCSVVDLSDHDLNLAPESPLRTNANLVRRASFLEGADLFDAKFFGIFPKEAAVMDPQHRLMLECCWHAIEDAGYSVDQIDAPVGVFAGCYLDTYLLASLASSPQLLESLANAFHGGDLLTELGNDKDYLATRISFLLDLGGPSMTVQTACSTSLVAIAQACQSLWSGDCEMALAGGCTLKLPQKRGYLYTEGGMVSPDGLCRTFDAKARGTIFGEGVGAVFLKRLDAALADGDDIYAVIRGVGVNNDGRGKVGYTAPSVEGQRRAIELAHQSAGISADSITYIEAHGTGTALGDPIEVDALSKAFRSTTDKRQFCAIGSVKTNIGHLDVAAGVTGLIKTSLALRHRLLPPSLHFEQANPNIDFESSPFFVNTALQQWDAPVPRRAGVSSFGVGGTNAHLVVEEAPQQEASPSSQKYHLLTLSAKSPAALEAMTENLGRHLHAQPQLPLADVAYTLQNGRKTFNYTRVLAARDSADAAEQLTCSDPRRVHTYRQVRRNTPIAFLFPGQGSQHPNMAADLLESDRGLREHFDLCADLLKPQLGFDIRDRYFAPVTEDGPQSTQQTIVAQTGIFSLSYALAMRLRSLGFTPARMVGHSVGEFVAACLAGVFSLEQALQVVAARASHMQELPGGSMLAVRLSEEQLAPRLGPELALAAVNGPELCVVSGPTQPLELLKSKLDKDEVAFRPLHTSHAFHSAMMQPAVAPLFERLQAMELRPPSIPIISSVTGLPLSDEQALDPNYWATHLRETVRFADALTTLLEDTEVTILEVGPGQTLSTLARQHPKCGDSQVVLSTLPHAAQNQSAAEHFWTSVGKSWQAGSEVIWRAIYDGEFRRRVHLPGYALQRERYWFDERPPGNTDTGGIEAAAPASTAEPTVPAAGAAANVAAVLRSQQTDASSIDSVTYRIVQQQLELMKQQLEAWNAQPAEDQS